MVNMADFIDTMFILSIKANKKLKLNLYVMYHWRRQPYFF